MEQPSHVVQQEPKDFDHIRIVHDDDELKVQSVTDVKKVLSQLSFAPSCVDMGWKWEVERVFTSEFDDIKMAAEFVHAGYRLRTTYMRPDRETKRIEQGWGRWWEIPLETTESGVVKTAFAATKMILDHELMESFKWKNTRVFDPHHTVSELASIQSGRYTMSIP